ncbi:MAG: ABC transporter ATP-binding protein [Desulfurococcales archaeon]|nr:ABC transporter ATP-binding protein [Desulfurococcales archaeon]
MALEVKHLRKTYGPIVAVDRLSFRVEEGSIHGLIGPNGSGKTTTFKSIVGLVIPDEGDVLLDGESLFTPQGYRLKSLIGFSPETPEAPRWLKVSEFLYLMFRADGMSRLDAEEMAEEASATFGLQEYMDTKLSRLSKGQRKRVLLAQALTPERRVYLLDEPMTGLDPEWVIKVRSILRKKAGEGSSILVSSHLLRELEAVVDSLTIIKYGVVVFSGTREELEAKLGPSKLKVFIEVDNPGLAKSVLGNLSYKLEEENNGLIVEAGSKDEVAFLVESLVKNGLKVYEVRVLEIGLEEAYMKLLRGKN